MYSGAYTLLGNVAVTGPSVTIAFAGQYLWEVIGTFTGATVALEILGPDNVTFIPVKNVTNTALADTGPDTDYVYLPAGAVVRASVTGGTPANLRARIRFAGQ